MKKRLVNCLLSWPFVLSVGLLLVNDLFLKAAYPGLVTGKLSDFAGLFMVALPLLAIFPSRKLLVCVLLAALFAWWKSGLSSFFIAWVQASGLPRFGRTVDLSDLFALPVLLLACHLTERIEHFPLPLPAPKKMILGPIAAIALFAALGSSQMPTKTSQYAIRDTTGRMALQREAVAQVIASVAAQYGMKCHECAQSQERGVLFGKGLTLNYHFTEKGELAFKVSVNLGGLPFFSNDEKDMEALRSALKQKFAERFPNLEYIEPIDPRR